MRAADFFALPSRRDSCPLVLLEALASGLPSIVSSRVGTADLVAGEAGFVVEDPDDDLAVADALRTLAWNPSQRAAMARAARAVGESHSWNEMAREYAALIEEQLPAARSRIAA
jgi:glycosyltransferase involved in cell wall biosynthesis